VPIIAIGLRTDHISRLNPKWHKEVDHVSM
jgi:hypothetical protein